MRRSHLLQTVTALAAIAACAACSSSSSSSFDDDGRVAIGESGLSSDAGDAGSTDASSSVTQALVEVTDVPGNPAKMKMFEYAPAKLAASPAVVLVMHGCNQGAADVAKTGWNDIADQLGNVVVVYPEQVTANNGAKCFNWGGIYGDLTSIQRGKDENQSIKDMVDKAVALHKADAKKVFIVGFSAGGAEAAIMAATWPEVFAAAATIAGIPYHCNTTFAETFACQKPGKDKTPAEWSTLVKEAGAPTTTTVWPRMSIWQGTDDSIVSPTNRNEMVEQWTSVHGLTQTPSATSTVDGATRTIFKDGSGKVLVESYEVPGMDHGVSVMPNAAKKCGSVAQNSYGLDKGICTAARVAEFFGLSSTMTATVDAGPKQPVTTSSTSTSSTSSSSSGGAGDASSTETNGSSAGAVTAPPPAKVDESAGSTCSFSDRSSSSSHLFSGGLLLALGSLLAVRRRRGST